MLMKKYLLYLSDIVDSILDHDQSNSSCGLQKHPEVVVVMWYVRQTYCLVDGSVI